MKELVKTQLNDAIDCNNSTLTDTQKHAIDYLIPIRLSKFICEHTYSKDFNINPKEIKLFQESYDGKVIYTCYSFHIEVIAINPNGVDTGSHYYGNIKVGKRGKIELTYSNRYNKVFGDDGIIPKFYIEK